MPKPLKKAPTPIKKAVKKRASSDPNRRATQMMSELAAKAATGQPPWAKSKAEPFDEYTATLTIKDGKMTVGKITKLQISEYMSKLGAKGGKASGAKRMTNLTPEQRQEIAAKAGRKRWENEKERRSRNQQ